MAKKKAAGEFNMAEAIRNLLRNDPKMTTNDVIEALEKAHPDRTFNRQSCSVAFSNARKALGIAPGGAKRGRGKKVVKKRVPSAAPARGATVDLAALQAAAKYVAAVGSTDVALEAVRQVVSLQIGK